MTQLNEIPKQSKIYCEITDNSDYIIFHHLDGMYSYCETEKGNPVNLSMFTELVEYKDGYKLKE